MNTNAQASGSVPDLLSSILRVEVRNEEKIVAEDREFCEDRQEKLYATFRQLKDTLQPETPCLTISKPT